MSRADGAARGRQAARPAPRAYVLVSVLLLLIVAAFASYLPARRAAKINPIEALRVE